VIDLYSLRQRVCSKTGILNALKQDLARYRLFTVADYTSEVIHVGERVSAASREALERRIAEHQVAEWNKLLLRVFPGGIPVTAPHVDDLIARFRKDTEATDKDRNRVRAHSYEHFASDAYRQTVMDVEGQITVFETYFNNLYLVLDRAWYCMDAIVYPNP